LTNSWRSAPFFVDGEEVGQLVEGLLARPDFLVRLHRPAGLVKGVDQFPTEAVAGFLCVAGQQQIVRLD
jgi:hypothetical protein